MVSELTPRFDTRASFYGKARVEILPDNTKRLYSYDTHIASITPDDEVVIYGTYSATTLRHIKEFLRQNGFRAENKAQIERDYMKEVQL